MIKKTTIVVIFDLQNSDLWTLYRGFFQTDRTLLQNAAYERFQSIEHVCGGAFYRNFQKEKLSESAVVIYRF